MTPSPAIRSFSEIRKHLDPCCNYVIFEEDGGGGVAGDFQKAFDRLPLDAEDVLDRQLYREAHSRLLLVARLAAGRGEHIRERILSQGIPPNTVLYYYGGSPDGGGHEIERL